MHVWVWVMGCHGDAPPAAAPADPGEPPVESSPDDTPPVDPRLGRTYEVVFAEATWVEPANAGPLLAQQSDGSLLLSPQALSVDGIALRAGAGESGAQHPCGPTAELSGGFTDPEFATDPAELIVELGDVMFPLSEVVVEGAFTADAEALERVSVDGVLDSRRIAEVAPEFGTAPDSFCTLLVTFGDLCGSCSDGEPYCIPARMVLERAPVAPGGGLAPRTADQVADDPACR